MDSLLMHVFTPITHIFSLLLAFYILSFALCLLHFFFLLFFLFVFSISLVLPFFLLSPFHYAHQWPFILPVMTEFAIFTP